MNQIVQIILYFSFFALSLYGLSAINFKKILFPAKKAQSQILILIIAMSIAYLSMQFLLSLTFTLN